MSELQTDASSPYHGHPPFSSDSGTPDILAALASDRSGYETFSRYRWQAKQSVWQWLTCLSSIDPPTAIVCEHVEDIVIVYESKLRFAQLKTRDKGSWSANRVCSEGHGIDALVRSFNEAEIHGLIEISTFELWLEGPMAEAKETVNFFASPTTAGPALRRKIIELGMPARKVDRFLERLIIRPQQPTRLHIDAVILQYIGALWPALSTPERESIFGGLLEAAQQAQANEHRTATVVARLAEQLNDSPQTTGASSSQKMTGIESLATQTLTRTSLLSRVPPLQGATREDLLARIKNGEVTSALELKMRAAGVTKQTLDLAQGLRAEAEIGRQEVLGSRPDAISTLESLERRVLQTADAAATRARLMAGGNPAIASQPGEYIVAELLSQPMQLAHLDSDKLFQADSNLVFGFLCHLSDTCKYWWQS